MSPGLFRKIIWRFQLNQFRGYLEVYLVIFSVLALGALALGLLH